MRRTIITACVLLAGLGGLLTAWYASSQRALAAELREREHRALRASADRERAIAENLSRRFEELRRTESQRPYFHYQNLYHDPKGASEGLSIVPSPLAAGPGNPLITAHFQIDHEGRVTLPTVNDELRELNTPIAEQQKPIRDFVGGATVAIRSAAAPMIESLVAEERTSRAAAARIADLEARLAATQQASANQQVQILDPSAFMQNAASNEFYREIKSRAGTVAPAPPPRATTREAPVEIRTTDLQWHTIAIGGTPRLVALRAVRTPAGNRVQGLLTPVVSKAVLDGGFLHRATHGASIEGTGWRIEVDPTSSLAVIRSEHLRVEKRFQRLFIAATALLLLVVAGIAWMVSRTEALAIEKSRFAATAAHELRTPLASLRLYSEMIADEQDPERRERYAREISGQTERLGRLVANVLEVTRIERGTFALKPVAGEIGRAIEACVEKLRPQMEAAGCPVELRVAPDLPNVAFDSDALHHIVDNLLDNAEKYSRDAPSRNVAVDVAPDNGGVSITVSDKGPGLPSDYFEHLRPFRASTSGLGLGLFLVDRIVRGHGGAIRSAPRPGGGASVQIFLPAFYKP